MELYHHSVRLEKGKCVGCTNCLKRCPTEAIRIRGGRATIVDDLCVDCGECIRVCQHHAKVAVTDPLSTINRFRYKIALPAPTLYGQFKNLKSASSVPGGLRRMGFDAVFDVSRGAEVVARVVQERLNEPDCPRPLISSACPAVTRLIQIRFPDLIDHVVDVKSPMEAAAIMAKDEFCKEKGCDRSDVGCFFITPCPAKVTAIRNPIGHATSEVDGAISMLEIYGLLSHQLRRDSLTTADTDSHHTALGIGWARSGGECAMLGVEEALAVDGIDNVNRVLEAIENDQLPDLLFFEGLACDGGCVGGPLAFENLYIARNRIRALVSKLPKDTPAQTVPEELLASMREPLTFEYPIKSLEAMKLDTDFKAALEKMDRIESICKKLPGLDCGSCGSPTCRALAEDIAGGLAREMDCLFLLKEQVREMAARMMDISEQVRDK
ncbi:MAG: [Fe-Fe] hydrogenase large subunit C-terminal domain-containing protein [Eubacteriales bacterium]|nr:[Fe-Fe] hydrogenase large subunit C-terminal domain-containing protein [Eubacteriales bacterium]